MQRYIVRSRGYVHGVHGDLVSGPFVYPDAPRTMTYEEAFRLVSNLRAEDGLVLAKRKPGPQLSSITRERWIEPA